MLAWKVNVGIFCIILQVFNGWCQQLDSLKLLAVVFRHGDRTPTGVIPNDKIREADWPEGLGQLTKIGILQQYHNGQYFRKRYNGFINQTYHHDQIYVRSTDMDRTLMSAQAMLAGLYHPLQDSQKWNDELPWMPIPVHTETQNQDYVFKASIFDNDMVQHHCPLASSGNILESDEAQSFFLKYQDSIDDLGLKADIPFKNFSMIFSIHDALVCEETFEYLANHSGIENFTNPNAGAIEDILICERAHNKGWPDWVSEDLFEKLHYEIVPGMTALEMNRTDLRNFHRGELVYNIADLFKMKMKEELDKNIRAFFFSAHDSTILAVLGSLDLYNSNKHIIPYCATIMLELHYTDLSGWFVQFFYKNSTDENATPHLFTIPGCIENCPLQQFINITDYYSYENWQRKCLKPRAFRIESLKEISIIAVTSGVAVLFLIVCLAFCCHRTCCRRRKRHRTYGRIRATELSRPEEVPMISSNSVGSDLDE